MTLKPETLAKIDAVITHYPEKRSAALPLLHLVQEDAGWISPEAVEWIAARLELQPINVYELVTFYPMFRQKPAGRRQVRVCLTLSCALAGAHAVRAELERGLGCAAGGTSPDGAVSLELVECLASCGTGPVVMVDEKLYERVDVARARTLAAEIRLAAAAPRATDGPPATAAPPSPP